MLKIFYIIITGLILFKSVEAELVDFITNLFFGSFKIRSHILENEAAEVRFVEDMNFLKNQPAEVAARLEKNMKKISDWQEYYTHCVLMMCWVADWALRRYERRDYHLKEELRIAKERLVSEPFCHSHAYHTDRRLKAIMCQKIFANEFFSKRNWVLTDIYYDHCTHIDVRKIEKDGLDKHDTVLISKEARKCIAKQTKQGLQGLQVQDENEFYVYLIAGRHFHPDHPFNSYFVLTEKYTRLGEPDKNHYYNVFSDHRKEITAYIETGSKSSKKKDRVDTRIN